MILYIMRHGTTVSNEKGITQGRTKGRLSKAGIQKTKQVAEELKNIPFDAIVCSPLTRTVQTANLVNVHHGVNVFKDELITEIDQGIFTGRKYSTLTEEEKALKKASSPKCGMEGLDHAFSRAKEFAETIKQKYPYKTLLVVTHNIMATFVEDVILNKPMDFDDPKFQRNFANAEVKKFEI